MERFGQLVTAPGAQEPGHQKQSNDWLIIDNTAQTLCKVSPDGLLLPWLGTPGVGGHKDGVGPAAGFVKPAFVAVKPSGGKDAGWQAVISDFRSHTLRRVDGTGQVSTLAGRPGKDSFKDGSLAEACFACPAGVAMDPEGQVFVNDSGNYVIRRVTPDGRVATLAGQPYEYGHRDGPGPEARFHRLRGLALDPPTGDLYVADGHCVRRVRADGQVETLLGNYKEPGFEEWMTFPPVGPRGLAGVRCLNEPSGLTLFQGLLFIADKNNHAIRVFDPATGSLRTLVGDPTQGKTRPGGLRNGAARVRPKQFAAVASPLSIAFDGKGGCGVSSGAGLVQLALGHHESFATPGPGMTLSAWVDSVPKPVQPNP